MLVRLFRRVLEDARLVAEVEQVLVLAVGFVPGGLDIDPVLFRVGQQIGSSLEP